MSAPTAPDELPEPVTSAGAVREMADAIRASGWFCIDLEFVSEGRYIPDLGLAQLSWGDVDEPTVAAIDPLAVDPGPVVALVGDPTLETVLHAAQADLALLAARHDVQPHAVVDTQIAAGFLGLGDQIGYGPLVEKVLGVRLDKGGQFTQWLGRPLSGEQLRYALDDVRYLPRVWAELRGELERRGRLGWVEEESARLVASYAHRAPPEEAYRRLRGWSALRGRSQGALRGLAAWREREALRLNMPPSRIIPDRTMVELARRIPDSARGLSEARGISEGAVRRFGEELLRALREGADDPTERERPRPPLPDAAQSWASMLTSLLAAFCREGEVAPRFVASRGDAEELARWWLAGGEDERPDLALLSGWRRELAGERLLDWLRGRAAIVADPDAPAGVGLVPLPPDDGAPLA